MKFSCGLWPQKAPPQHSDRKAFEEFPLISHCDGSFAGESCYEKPVLIDCSGVVEWSGEVGGKAWPPVPSR